MAEFKLKRLGTIMESEKDNELEAAGVLNPGAVRGPDGHLYLFPRLVAKGNYSRIGIARVIFNDAGDPVSVERLGVVLEPEADYELRPGGGGCEDPRVTFVEPLNHYVMSYVAFGPTGPRIAIARSTDLFKWERIGLARFSPYEKIKFEGVDNKDSCVFPTLIKNPLGHSELALIHRPLFPGTRPEELKLEGHKREVDIHCESIWISYCPFNINAHTPVKGANFTSHHRLAAPEAEWEKLKIGCGTPPVMTKHGWMIIYHGVSEIKIADTDKTQLCYSAGVMILSKDKPTDILYRSPEPILKPELEQERVGFIADVVFPTGIDRRDDIGMPNRFDIYYGMADDRVGVARLDVPDELPKT
jgi:beta-1,2-mannobiose phosphorylase / 1,2-beta-oligomannan phosphorylase